MLQGLETWTLHFPESLDSRILILLLPVRDLEGKSGEATIAIATMAHGTCEISWSFCDSRSAQSWGSWDHLQFLVMLVHPDFLNMSGGFSDLGSHSSSYNSVSLSFPVLNPFLPEILRIVCIF